MTTVARARGKKIQISKIKPMLLIKLLLMLPLMLMTANNELTDSRQTRLLLIYIHEL
jgi:hypothetical protein